MDWETLEVIPATEKAYQCSCLVNGNWTLTPVLLKPFSTPVSRDVVLAWALKQIQNLFLCEKFCIKSQKRFTLLGVDEAKEF